MLGSLFTWHLDFFEEHLTTLFSLHSIYVIIHLVYGLQFLLTRFYSYLALAKSPWISKSAKCPNCFLFDLYLSGVKRNPVETLDLLFFYEGSSVQIILDLTLLIIIVKCRAQRGGTEERRRQSREERRETTATSNYRTC